MIYEFLLPNNLKPAPWREFWWKYLSLIFFGAGWFVVYFSISNFLSWDETTQSLKVFGIRLEGRDLAWMFDVKELSLSIDQFATFVVNCLVAPTVNCIFVIIGILVWGPKCFFSSLVIASWSRILKYIISFSAILIATSYCLEWSGTYSDPERWEFKHAFLVTLIGGGIIGPIFEEFLFRFVLYQFFRIKFSFLVAALISGFLFGWIHCGYPDPLKIFLTALAGFLCAWIYERTGSILTPIGLHIFNNSIPHVLSHFF
jgi:membrane protease YdiL (CAAX protease family)